MPELRSLCEEAGRRGDPDPNAATLSTAAPDGRPSARIVFVSLSDDRGPCVFVNRNSGKARQMAANPYACLSYFWPRLEVQAIVDARAEPLADEDSDRLWAHRSRDSQVGAWASLQNGTAVGNDTLSGRAADLRKRFSLDAVPRPRDWTAFCLHPETVTIWPSGWHRLRTRHRWMRPGDGDWVLAELNP